MSLNILASVRFTLWQTADKLVEWLSFCINRAFPPIFFMQDKPGSKEKIKAPGRVLPQLSTVIYLYTISEFLLFYKCLLVFKLVSN